MWPRAISSNTFASFFPKIPVTALNTIIIGTSSVGKQSSTTRQNELNIVSVSSKLLNYEKHICIFQKSRVSICSSGSKLSCAGLDTKHKCKNYLYTSLRSHESKVL